jgi:hypothetical protein
MVVVVEGKEQQAFTAVRLPKSAPPRFVSHQVGAKWQMMTLRLSFESPPRLDDRTTSSYGQWGSNIHELAYEMVWQT